jgi:hypothetical protein
VELTTQVTLSCIDAERSARMHPEVLFRPVGRLQRIARIVAALLASPVLVPLASAQEPWRTEDIIDQRIDEDAQYALMRMLVGQDVGAAAKASAILSAVKDGTLGGIYQADRQVPALRVRSFGGNWWEIIPSGSDAICELRPSGSKPIIIYRKGVGKVPSRLDPSLLSAWGSCGLEDAPPRPYVVTIVKPQPTPAPPPAEAPPPFPARLTVIVTSGGQRLAGASVGIDDTTAGKSISGTTDPSGMAHFDPSPGLVIIVVRGPGSLVCDSVERELVVVPGSQTATIELSCKTAATSAPKCDVDKWNGIFDECGRGVLGGAVVCLKDVYLDYAKCKRDPTCVAENLAKFWKCRKDLDHVRKIQACVDKANAASNCNYPGPK